MGAGTRVRAQAIMLGVCAAAIACTSACSTSGSGPTRPKPSEVVPTPQLVVPGRPGTCNRADLSIQLGGTASYGIIETSVELNYRGTRPFRVVGFPTLQVSAAASPGGAAVRTRQTRSGPSRGPVEIEPSHSDDRVPSAAFDLRLGADLPNGTDVTPVRIARLDVAFSGIRCSLELGSAEVDTATGTPLQLSVGSWSPP